jgi:hypothetical protein
MEDLTPTQADILFYSCQRMTGFEQWREYRKRRNLFLFAFLGFVPTVGAFGSLTRRMPHTEVLFAIFAFSWMAFFAVAIIRLNSWRCPRCGNWFAAKWWYRNPFTQRCLHCGLPKYSNF